MFFEHDLLGKSESTFRDHALEAIIDACAHHVHLNASGPPMVQPLGVAFWLSEALTPPAVAVPLSATRPKA